MHENKIYDVAYVISGVRLGNDIDVYMELLIDDLKLLWEKGFDVFDSYCQETFCLCAILFSTINDFSSYEHLSGYSGKGNFAFFIFEENTSYIQLKHDQNIVSTRHTKFLPRNHSDPRMKKKNI